MEKRAVKRSFAWFIVLVLPLILILGVLPCAAQSPQTLQDLIDQNIPIQVGNLIFSGFKLNSDPYAYPTPPLVIPQAENITVEKVGEETTSPGLKFTPNFQVGVQPDSGTAPYFLKTISFSYQVNAVDGSGLIAASSLILNPGIVEAQGDLARALVQDAGGQITKAVYVSKSLNTTSQEYVLEEKLQDDTNFSPSSAVSSKIVLGLTVYSPGGEASIDSFEQRFTQAPAPGSPIADAGDDQVVFDQVSLNGSGSSPDDAKYQWELYQIVGDSLTLVGGPEPQVQATFTDLVNGFYEARLTVTSSGVSAVDTAIIAAAGPSSGGGNEEISETELNLWNFELKKYKYCKWSTARMLGTFDLPDDFEFNQGDDLIGKVTVEIDRDGEPVIVMSDDLELKVKNWRHKLVIHGDGR